MQSLRMGFQMDKRTERQENPKGEPGKRSLCKRAICQNGKRRQKRKKEVGFLPDGRGVGRREAENRRTNSDQGRGYTEGKRRERGERKPILTNSGRREVKIAEWGR